VPPQKSNIEPRSPAAAQLLFQQLLTDMRVAFEDLLEKDLYPKLPPLVEENARDRGLVVDSADETLAQIMYGIGLVYGKVHTKEAIAFSLAQVAQSVAANARREAGRQLAAEGIQQVQLGSFSEQLLKDFVRSNTARVKNLTAGQLETLQGIVTDGFRQGLRVEGIQASIQKQLDLNRVRAALLARDQVGKLQGEFIQLEQVQAGVTEYIWRTAGDERVREGHRSLNKTRQRWSSPPVVSVRKGVARRAHPGQDIQCRCYPQPILPDRQPGGPLVGPEAPVPPSPVAAVGLSALVASALFDEDEEA